MCGGLVLDIASFLFLFLFLLPVFTCSILFPLWVQWRDADRSVGEREGEARVRQTSPSYPSGKVSLWTAEVLFLFHFYENLFVLVFNSITHRWAFFITKYIKDQCSLGLVHLSLLKGPARAIFFPTSSDLFTHKLETCRTVKTSKITCLPYSPTHIRALSESGIRPGPRCSLLALPFAPGPGGPLSAPQNALS